MNWRNAGSRSRTTRSGYSCAGRGGGSKNTLFALEQARPDVARRRRRWRTWQASLDPRRLVFIDETWIKTNMAPLRGWAPKGERLRGFAPHGHWRTMTFLGALRCDNFTAPCVFDGPINGECFRAYVAQVLLPTLNGPPAQGSGICRLTHPTSIRSSRPLPKSNTGCEQPKNAPSKTFGATSEASSAQSKPVNAVTTSQTLDTLQSNRETL